MVEERWLLRSENTAEWRMSTEESAIAEGGDCRGARVKLAAPAAGDRGNEAFVAAKWLCDHACDNSAAINRTRAERRTESEIEGCPGRGTWQARSSLVDA